MSNHSRTRLFLHVGSNRYPVTSLEGTEAVNERLDLKVIFSSPELINTYSNRGERKHTFVYQFVSLQLISGDTERWWHGHVSDSTERVDIQGHRWELTITNKLFGGQFQTRTRLWLHQTRKEVLQALLKEMGYYRYEYTFALDEVTASEGPFLQAQESNYDCFKRLLSEIGASFWFDYDGEVLHEQMIISNTPFKSRYLPELQWVQSVSGLAPTHRLNRIVKILPQYNVVPSKHGFATDAFCHASSLIPIDANHEHFSPPRAEKEAQQRALFAQQHANQDALKLHVTSHQPLLTAGYSMTIDSGRYLGYKLESGDVRLLSVTHKAQILNEGSGLEYSNTAVAIPRETPVRPPLVELEGLPQFFSAQIESSYEYAQVTNKGHYLFRPNFEPAPEHGGQPHANASPPTERILPYASPVRRDMTKKVRATGWHFPMLNKSSVLVTCLNNDPNHLAIVGFIPIENQKGPVTSANRTQHRIVTSSQNELLMDDADKAKRFALFTFDGQTMLNMLDSDKDKYVQLTCIYGGFHLEAHKAFQFVAQSSLAMESGQQVDIKTKQRASITTESEGISMQSADTLTLESKGDLSLTSTEGDLSIWAQQNTLTQRAKSGLSYTASGGNVNTLVKNGSVTLQVNGGDVQLTSEQGITITDGTGGIKIDAQGNIKLWGRNIYFDSDRVTFNGDIEYDSGGNKSEDVPELELPELPKTTLLEFDPVEAFEGEPGRYIRSRPVIRDQVKEWSAPRRVRPFVVHKTLKSILRFSPELEKLANKKGSSLRKGCTQKADVKRIQRALIDMEFNLGKSGDDGDFGPTTEKRVKEFQSLYKETHTTHQNYDIGPVDGIVGNGTLLGIDEALSEGWKNTDDEMDEKWLTVSKGKLTFDVEGNDVESSRFFSRKPHIPHRGGQVIDNSGITIGRGLDIGKRDASEVELMFNAAAKNAKPISPKLLTWLKQGAGKTKQEAYKHWKTLDTAVPTDEQHITRKMQYFLFLENYDIYVKKAKRLTTKKDVREAYIDGAELDWDALPDNVKDVLVDLTYRGDYTGSEDKRGNTRKLIIPAIYRDLEEQLSGDTSYFFEVMQSPSVWLKKFSVDPNRYKTRHNELL